MAGMFDYQTRIFFHSVCVCAHVCKQTWRSENNLRELILSFYYVGCMYQTQGFRCGSKQLYSLSHLTGRRLATFGKLLIC